MLWPSLCMVLFFILFATVYRCQRTIITFISWMNEQIRNDISISKNKAQPKYSHSFTKKDTPHIIGMADTFQSDQNKQKAGISQKKVFRLNYEIIQTNDHQQRMETAMMTFCRKEAHIHRIWRILILQHVGIHHLND